LAAIVDGLGGHARGRERIEPLDAPRQTRDRSRSAQFTDVHERRLTGHDGSPRFSDNRVGRTSKLVMRVRFPSPALRDCAGHRRDTGTAAERGALGHALDEIAERPARECVMLRRCGLG